MAARRVRRRLGRDHVAGRSGRPRRSGLAAAHLQRGAVALQRRDRRVRGRHRDGRPDDHRVGHARAAGALPARDAARRRGVVPAVLRAGRGLRPRRACARAPSATATSGPSTARRCGRRARTTATGASCSRAATPTRRSTRASPRSCSTCARRASTCGPLRQINGASHFNEVFLTDVRIPDAMRLGRARRRLARREHDAVERAGDDRRRRPRRLPRPRRARAALRRRTTIRVLRQELARSYTRIAAHQVARLAGAQPQGPGPRPRGVGVEARGVAPARVRRQPRAWSCRARSRCSTTTTRSSTATGSSSSSGSGAAASAAAPSRSSATSSASGCSGLPSEPRPGQGHAVPRAPVIRAPSARRPRMQLDEFQELMARTYGDARPGPRHRRDGRVARRGARRAGPGRAQGHAATSSCTRSATCSRGSRR